MLLLLSVVRRGRQRRQMSVYRWAGKKLGKDRKGERDKERKPMANQAAKLLLLNSFVEAGQLYLLWHILRHRHTHRYTHTHPGTYTVLYTHSSHGNWNFVVSSMEIEEQLPSCTAWKKVGTTGYLCVHTCVCVRLISLLHRQQILTNAN